MGALLPTDDWGFVGLTINAKYMIPCLAWQAERAVLLTALTGEDIGAGSFNEQEELGEPEELTGYPRVHTLPGIFQPYRDQRGYGTALYTALAVVAKLNSDETVDVSEYKEPGVSSWRPREQPAEDWWTAAKARGDATHVREVVPATARFHGSSSDDDAKPQLIPVKGFTGRDNTDVLEYEIDFEYGYFKEGEADLYTFARADEKNLVVAMVSEPSLRVPAPVGLGLDALYPEELGQSITDANKKLFAAINTGYLREHRNGRVAFDALMRFGRVIGVAPRDLKRMEYRFDTGMDVEPDPAAAPKRRRSRKATPNPDYEQNETSYRVKLYGNAIRANPDDESLLNEARSLIEERVTLGLDEYAEDV